MVRDWHAPIPALLATTDPATVQRHPVEDLARPLASYRRGRVVLLGDAAHAMTPDLGQGANQALEDAAELTAHLAPLVGSPEPRFLEAALEAYDACRRPRSQQIAARARQVGRLAQASGRLGATLRDTLLRIAPDSAATRQSLTVQDWTPPRIPVPARL